MRRVGKLFATLFYIGYCPIASGTVGSLAAVICYLLLKDNFPLLACVTVSTLAIGFWSSSIAEREFSRKDPPEIVIDEFASMLLAYLFLPYSAGVTIAGFFIFRFFDIAKIPPLRKLEALPGGYGIMLDDIGAAILTNIALRVIVAISGT